VSFLSYPSKFEYYTSLYKTNFFCFLSSKINIGTSFQADVPLTTEDPRNAIYDKHRAAVCWIPFEHETRKREQES
jgi:hypothetical protein